MELKHIQPTDLDYFESSRNKDLIILSSNTFKIKEIRAVSSPVSFLDYKRLFLSKNGYFLIMLYNLNTINIKKDFLKWL